MEGNRRKRSTLPWVRGVAVLVVGMLTAGAFAIAPATAKKAFTKKKALRLFYSKAGADARFINVGEKASDADMLDGQDATAFLGAGAKVVSKDVGNLPEGDISLSGTYTTAIDLASVHTGGADERLNTTSQSRILASAVVDIYTTTAEATETLCRLTISDGSATEAITEEHEVNFPAESGYDVSVPLHGGVIKPPGTYDVDAQCLNSEDVVDVNSADLIVWAIPV